MKNSQKISTNPKVQQNYSYEELLKNDYIPQESKDELQKIFKLPDEQISVKDAIASLRSENFTEMHKSAIRLRKTLFDFYQAEQIAQVHELVPLLIHLIEHGSTSVIKLESAWIISILTRGSTDVNSLIFQNGMVRLSQKALSGNKSDLKMRIIQILGILAGESVIYRDSILQICGIQLIIDNIEPKYEAIYIRCLANLCIGRPSPQLEVIYPAFKIFAKVIMSENGNIKMINDAIWALGYMINGEQNRITALINSGVVPQLINLLPLCNVVSILQIFERIFYGTEAQIKYLLECGFVSHIQVMLDPKINVNTGEMIQTFAAKETLFKVLSNQNFLQQLFKSLSEDNSNLRGDALEVIAKAVQHGTNEDVSLMVKNRLILHILQMLEMAHVKEIASVQLKKGLEILIKLIRKGHVNKEKNQYFTEFVQMGGIGAIQKLSSCRRDDVAEYALLFKQEFAL